MDNLRSDSENEVSKIKVTCADIICRKVFGKPYFEIKYKIPNDDEYYYGFGSACLENVFSWLEECFELVN